MLEQAIVDAEALKEAAIKNAEAAVIERYASDIKEAVESLLEAPEDEEDPLGDLGGDMGMDMMGDEGGLEDTLPDVPAASSDGEALCPCPEESEPVIVDFDQLAAAVSAEEEMAGTDQLGMGDDDELTMGALGDEDPLAALGDEEEEEEIELEEELLAKLAKQIEEVLSVDVENVPTGHIGGVTNPAEEEEHEDIKYASARDDKRKELSKDAEKAIKDLQEKVEALLKRNTSLKENRDKYLQVIDFLKKKVTETSVSNAKLLYTNRILNSGSLNERQKQKVVEAINNAKTVKEAKVIFETLQSAVESGRTISRTPKSLSEAVARNSSGFLPRRQSQEVDPEGSEIRSRWARLAGIEKS